MLFSKAIITSVIAAVSVSGAPIETRDEVAFKPSALWKYNVGTGAITASVVGEVDKSNTNRGQDLTTLMTFTYPPEATGKKCQFFFGLHPDDTLTGSKKLDLYTSNKPATASTTTWGPGNQRNIHLGRLNMISGGEATWEGKYNGYLTDKVDCKPAGTVEGFEVVGVYDTDRVSWNPIYRGPRIVITPN
ncbi:unnamed protein product [Clonostachys rosea]|uniref:Ubiquitin 3 binding protein But2 C-terminal domain-containing protein n=1 Tax=Bionectria ochroleuca TaxID=29856 RepID=A0ABY6V2T3_BIOOC|nr:unnamed protein product [Clonostachys rosea]